MQTQLPVIRTYTGPDRQAAEAAYRADVRTAQAGGLGPGRASLADRGRPARAGGGVRAPGAPSAAELQRGTPAVPEPAADASGRPSGPRGRGGEPTRADRGSTRPSWSTRPRSPSRRPSAHLGRSVLRGRTRARSLETIDLHAGGEPIRLIRSGYPQVPFAPILERRRWVREHADGARQVLMYEPRGHRDMYGAVLLPPYRPDADIAVLFMHNEGYSTMCGHGVIALTTGLIEEGLYPATMPATTIRWETPGGPGHGGRGRGAGRGRRSRGARASGSRTCPRTSTSRTSGCPSMARGRCTVQLAFGGAYYGIVDAADLGLRVVPASIDALTPAGAAITEVAAARPLADPSDRRRPGLRLRHHHRRPRAGHRARRARHDRDDAQRDRLRRRGGRPLARAARVPARCWPGCTPRAGWSMGQDIRNASITGEVFEGRVEATDHPGQHATPSSRAWRASAT